MMNMFTTRVRETISETILRIVTGIQHLRAAAIVERQVSNQSSGDSVTTTVRFHGVERRRTPSESPLVSRRFAWSRRSSSFRQFTHREPEEAIAGTALKSSLSRRTRRRGACVLFTLRGAAVSLAKSNSKDVDAYPRIALLLDTAPFGAASYLFN